jgi:hypothetical protein
MKARLSCFFDPAPFRRQRPSRARFQGEDPLTYLHSLEGKVSFAYLNQCLFKGKIDVLSWSNALLQETFLAQSNQRPFEGRCLLARSNQRPFVGHEKHGLDPLDTRARERTPSHCKFPNFPVHAFLFCDFGRLSAVSESNWLLMMVSHDLASESGRSWMWEPKRKRKKRSLGTLA